MGYDARQNDVRRTSIHLVQGMEYFDVVNEKDEVIGRATREECHRKGLLHRALHVIILNSKGEMLLQKRSNNVELYKGAWSDAAAGHVDAGETYRAAAVRETKEELGVSVKLEELFRIRKKYAGEGKIDDEFIMVFLGTHDGPFIPSEEEVSSIKFARPKDVLGLLKEENFTPATHVIFDEMRKYPAILKRLGLS